MPPNCTRNTKGNPCPHSTPPPAHVALDVTWKVIINSTWELTARSRAPTLLQLMEWISRTSGFSLLEKEIDFTLIYLWKKKVSFLQQGKISTVQHYFNCVSAGRKKSRMIKTLVVISDLFQDTLNSLLLIGPSESVGSQTLLAYTHFKHHLIAWCDNSLSDDPVLIHKHSHYQAQTGHNLAKSWWNRNKHNV